MARHSSSKNGVATLAYAPAIHVFWRKNANYETWLRRLLRLGTRCRLHRPSGATENPWLLGGAGGQLGLDLAGEKRSRRSLRPILRVRKQPLCRHAADDHGTGQ